MALAVLIAITLACIAWSLWIRRVTWSCRWEVAATLNIALQGATVLLMSPLASETLGHWLHSLTGMWNLEDYIGHDMYIVAASAIVYNALGRLQDDHAMQTHVQAVRRAAGHAVHPAAAGHVLPRQRRGDLQRRLLRTAHRLLADRLLAAALRHAHLPAGLRLARAADPAQGSALAARSPTSIWSPRSAASLACAVRIVTALVPSLQPVENGTLVWIFACMCGAGFALTSAHSWRIKTKWFSKASR